MNHSNRPAEASVRTLALKVALLSILLFWGASAVVPFMQAVYQELGLASWMMQFVFLSYRWLWVGAIFSGMVWWLVRQRVLSERLASRILIGIAICTVSYAGAALVSFYSLSFRVIDVIK